MGDRRSSPFPTSDAPWTRHFGQELRRVCPHLVDLGGAPTRCGQRPARKPPTRTSPGSPSFALTNVPGSRRPPISQAFVPGTGVRQFRSRHAEPMYARRTPGHGTNACTVGPAAFPQDSGRPSMDRSTRCVREPRKPGRRLSKVSTAHIWFRLLDDGRSAINTNAWSAVPPQRWRLTPTTVNRPTAARPSTVTHPGITSWTGEYPLRSEAPDCPVVRAATCGWPLSCGERPSSSEPDPWRGVH